MRLRALTAVAAALACGPFAHGLDVGLGTDGSVLPAIDLKTIIGKKSSAASAGNAAASASGPAEPILAANTVYQLPPAVEARSMNLGSYRRAIYVTDGKLHNRRVEPWWKFWATSEPGFPFGYILRPDGTLDRKLLFRGRTLQPYGVAEAPEDGRVCVTFYQGPMVEVWEGDLSMAWSYNEHGTHPSIPFFVPPAAGRALKLPGGTLAVPFDIMDVMNDHSADSVQLWLYNKDAGKRVEVFSRAQFDGMNLPHSVAFHVAQPKAADSSAGKDGKEVKGREQVYMLAAGLQEWIWEEGRGRGMWLVRDKWANESSPVRLNVYKVVTGAKAKEVQAEAARRWKEANPTIKDQVPPAGSPQLAQHAPLAGLKKVASHRFGGVCKWPLFSLVNRGQLQYAVTGCYDDAWLEVLQITGEDGAYLTNARKLARIVKPYGISKLGAIVTDPVSNGATVALLDRTRARIFSMPFPLPEALMAGKGEDQGQGHVPTHTGGVPTAKEPILSDGNSLPTTTATFDLTA